MKPYIMNYSDQLEIQVCKRSTNLDTTTQTFTIENADNDEITLNNDDTTDVKKTTFTTNTLELTDNDSLECCVMRKLGNKNARAIR